MQKERDLMSKPGMAEVLQACLWLHQCRLSYVQETSPPLAINVLLLVTDALSSRSSSREVLADQEHVRLIHNKELSSYFL